MRTSRSLCGYLDSSDLIPSKERLVSTSLANLVQVWCQSNMWPGYVISARSCCKSGSSPRTKMGLTYRDEEGWGGTESWHVASCEIVLNHKYILNAATPTHSMWYAYFSPLSGFTFHTLRSLGILGTADSRWLRAERHWGGIQLACAPQLQLLYGCVITEKRRGEIGRCWERGEGKKGGGRRKKNKREKEQAVLVFCHTPSGIQCYL